MIGLHAYAWALLGPWIVLALYGLFRIQRMQDVLKPDWDILAEFGAALQSFTQKGGRDPGALAAMEALAPDVAPLVFGFHPAAHRPVPAGIEPFPAPAAPAPGAPAADLRPFAPAVLFGRLADLAHAWDDPAANPAATGERARLENLRGQVVAADWLLQSEMQRLSRAEGNVNAWLKEGVAGFLLAFAAPFGPPDVAARTRRRMLEADPRFQGLTRVGTFGLMALGILGVVDGFREVFVSLVARAAHS